MSLKILHIDDDWKILSDSKKNLIGEKFEKHKITQVETANFQEGLLKLREQEFDIVVLDLCKGDPNADSEKVGEDILAEIQGFAFVPVVFFTGLPQHVKNLESEIIRVCSKGDGFSGLIDHLNEILQTDYLDLKYQIVGITKESIRSFFWNFVHPNKDLISNVKDEVSLTYLLLRRLSKMLSKEQIINFINDDKLKRELAHSMEFYIYPPLEGEFEMGDILKKKDSDEIYVVLTPSCDLIERKEGKRKAENILLIKALYFENFLDYRTYRELLEKVERSKEEERRLKNLAGKIKNWMRNNQGDKDRFFFLPETVFLKSSIVDFQHKLLVQYPSLSEDFKVVARLDDPFAQSLLSAFTRYYNRIGFPDLDVEYSFGQLFEQAK